MPKSGFTSAVSRAQVYRSQQRLRAAVQRVTQLPSLLIRVFSLRATPLGGTWHRSSAVPDTGGGEFVGSSAYPNPHDDGLKDHPAIKAIYDIEEVQRLLFVLAIRFNDRHRRRQALTAGMVESKVRPVPRRIYAWAKARGCTHTFPIEKARLGILPTFEARVTAEGIKLKGLRFKIPDLDLGDDITAAINSQDWLIKARKRSWVVHVGVDETTVNLIWLWHRNGNGEVIPVECRLSDEHSGYRDYTWPEYELTKKEDGQLDAEYDSETRFRTDSWARGELAAMTEKAQAKTAEARSGLSNREQIDGIDERRNREKRDLSERLSAVSRQSKERNDYFDDSRWAGN